MAEYSGYYRHEQKEPNQVMPTGVTVSQNNSETCACWREGHLESLQTATCGESHEVDGY